jgi:hypothetical protein
VVSCYRCDFRCVNYTSVRGARGTAVRGSSASCRHELVRGEVKRTGIVEGGWKACKASMAAGEDAIKGG